MTTSSIPSSKGQKSALGAARKLYSWKTIADYLGCDERTAKRWERERHMPVHRAPGGKRSGVFAFAPELDEWLCPPGPLGDSGAGSTAFPAQRYGALHDRPEMSSPESAILLEAAAGQATPRHRIRRILAIGAPCLVVTLAAVLLWRPLRMRLLDRPPAVATASTRRAPPEAEQLYLRGRYLWNLRTADSLAKAIAAYQQAISKYPSYAEAYAGLAESYDLLPQFGDAKLGDALPKAKEAADRAIALNANLATAHTAKAFALFFWDWDIPASDSEFRRALALDPDSAQTHQWYASTLHSRLEGAECLKQIDEALRLNPTSPAIASDAAFMHASFGDLAAGMAALREMDRTQPNLSLPSELLQDFDWIRGDDAAFVADARRYASITRRPDDLALADAMDRGLSRAGKRGLLEARAKALQAAFEHGTESGFYLGETLVLLGRRTEALPYFKASLKQRTISLLSMQQCTWARPLATDPGYAALFTDIRGQMHGDIAHPAVAPVFLRQPK